MQEEIIPLMPLLLILGRGLGIEAVSVVALSAGAAMSEVRSPPRIRSALVLAVGVPSQRWFRFAIEGVGIALLVDIAGMFVGMRLRTSRPVRDRGLTLS